MYDRSISQYVEKDIKRLPSTGRRYPRLLLALKNTEAEFIWVRLANSAHAL
jgi:hypothetical protein